MNNARWIGETRNTRIVVVLLMLLLIYGGVTYSPQAAAPIQAYSISLGGLTGATNNTVLAYGRYVVVAPFWPSSGVATDGNLDLSQLDNRFLYVIDTKKPNNPPLSKELTGWDKLNSASKTVYFPTKVVFDPNSSIVYVKGTRFADDDGQVTPIDVIAYLHLNLDDNGKPVFDNYVISIDIKSVSPDNSTVAPQDFGLSSGGNLLVFTNGASIFSFDLSQGYLNEVPIVDPKEYGTNDFIYSLDVDQTTNIVSVGRNRRVADADGIDRVSSELSFYQLQEPGALTLIKHVSFDQLGAGGAAKSLALCSNVEIVSGDDGSALAVFMREDGYLCSVDLRGDGVEAIVKELYLFPSLARSSSDDPTRLLVRYDASTRAIGVVNPGFAIQISRPINGKKGRISRPINLHIATATPVLAMAKLNKKSKVASANAFSKDFADEGGLSNFVSWQDAQWLISTYSGKLYSVGIPSDLQDATLQYIGPIGSKVDRIDYYGDRDSIVAVESCTMEDDGLQVASPGSLVVGKLSSLQSQPNGSVLQALLPTAAMLGRRAPAIRRPCNIRR